MKIKKYLADSSKKQRKQFNRSLARACYAMHIIAEYEELHDLELRKSSRAIKKFFSDIEHIRALLSEEAYAQLCADEADFAAANRAYEFFK